MIDPDAEPAAALPGAESGSDPAAVPKSIPSQPLEVLEAPLESLSSSDVIELTKLANHKARIIEHTQLLESRPKIKVFDGFKTMEGGIEVVREVREADVARHDQNQEWTRELEEIAAETERFNGADMNRVRTVAKAASERHMSPRDTDLIEITLDTIVALEKLSRLLEARRTLLDLSAIRSAWEECRHSCWMEHFALSDIIDTFVRVTARWDSSFASSEAPAGESSPTNSRHTGLQRDPSSHSVSVVDGKDSLSSPTTSIRHLPTTSRPHYLLTERLEVEHSRLASRLRKFIELVARSATALDAIIEQMQVPDSFLDEQDKLESLATIADSRGNFIASLAAQWRKADFLFSACMSISHSARDLTALMDKVKGERPNHDDLTRFSSSSASIAAEVATLIGHAHTSSSALAAPAFGPAHSLPSPLHPDWLDQESHNVAVQRILSKELAASVRRARRAATAVSLYERILLSYERAQDLQASLEAATAECKHIETLAESGWKGDVCEDSQGSRPNLQTSACLEHTLHHAYYVNAIKVEQQRLQTLINRAATDEHELSAATLDCLRYGLIDRSFQEETDAAIASYGASSSTAAAKMTRAIADVHALKQARLADVTLRKVGEASADLLDTLLQYCASAGARALQLPADGAAAGLVPATSYQKEEALEHMQSMHSNLLSCHEMTADLQSPFRCELGVATPNAGPIVHHLTTRIESSRTELERLSCLITWCDSAEKQATAMISLAQKYTALHNDANNLRRQIELAGTELSSRNAPVHSRSTPPQGSEPTYESIFEAITHEKQVLDDRIKSFEVEATNMRFTGPVPALLSAESSLIERTQGRTGHTDRSASSDESTEDSNSSFSASMTHSRLTSTASTMSFGTDGKGAAKSALSITSVTSVDTSIRERVNEMCASLADSQDKIESALKSSRESLQKRRQAEEAASRKAQLFEEARASAQVALEVAHATLKERSDGFEDLLKRADRPDEDGEVLMADTLKSLPIQRSSVSFPRFKNRNVADLRTWRDHSREVFAQHQADIRSRLDALRSHQQELTADLYSSGKPVFAAATPPGKSLTSSSIKLLNHANIFDQKVEQLMRDFEERLAKEVSRRQGSESYSDSADSSMIVEANAARSNDVPTAQNGPDVFGPTGGTTATEALELIPNRATPSSAEALLSDQFERLMRQLRGGEVEQQADSSAQRGRLLPLPSENAAIQVKSEWNSLKNECQDFLAQSSTSPTKTSSLRKAVEKRGPLVRHFLQLAAFAKVFEESEEALSKLLDAIDEAAGTSMHSDSSPSPEEDRLGEVPFASINGCEAALAALRDRLGSAQSLIENAREKADAVARDGRVRESLGKVERLWREMSIMAREVLEPGQARRREPSEDFNDEADVQSVVSVSSSEPSIASSEGRRTPGNDDDRSDASSIKSFATQPDQIPPVPPVDHSQAMTSTPRQPSKRRIVSESASPRKSSGGFAVDYRSPYSVSKIPKASAGSSRDATPPLPSKTPSRIPRRIPSSGERKLSVRKATASSTRPNHYRPNPKSKLDQAVARIVNHLPVPVSIAHASVGPHAKPSDSWKDESGRYWVGDPDPKLCFCRILRSRTVMVRVGGGWQELQSYLYSRYSHLAASVDITSPTGTTSVQISPSGTRNGGLPWLSSATMQRSLSGSSPGTSDEASNPRRSSTSGHAGSSPFSRRRVESVPDLSKPRSTDSPVPALPIMPFRPTTDQWVLETPSKRRPHSPEIARLRGESSSIDRRSPGGLSRSFGDLAPPFMQTARRASTNTAELLNVSKSGSTSSLLVPRRSPVPRSRNVSNASNASEADRTVLGAEAPHLVFSPSDGDGVGKIQPIVIVQPRKSPGGPAPRPMWR